MAKKPKLTVAQKKFVMHRLVEVVKARLTLIKPVGMYHINTSRWGNKDLIDSMLTTGTIGQYVNLASINYDHSDHKRARQKAEISKKARDIDSKIVEIEVAIDELTAKRMALSRAREDYIDAQVTKAHGKGKEQLTKVVKDCEQFLIKAATELQFQEFENPDEFLANREAGLDALFKGVK